MIDENDIAYLHKLYSLDYNIIVYILERLVSISLL